MASILLSVKEEKEKRKERCCILTSVVQWE